MLDLNPLALSGLAVLPILWTLAWFVLRAAPRRKANRRLALLLFTEGFLVSMAGGLTYLMADAVDAIVVRRVAGFPLFAASAAYLAFLATIDSPLARPLRARITDRLLILLALSGAIALLLRPSLLVIDLRSYGVAGPWEAGWTGPLATIGFGMYAASSFYGLAIALSAWQLAPRDSAARTQARWYAIAFGTRDATFGLVMTQWSLGISLGDVTTWGAWDVYLTNATSAVFGLLLAYAILRHQLLGIDVTIKWTIKQSTVAAIFLATIFLVSEGAQLVFGEEQAWLGLAAGGLLVFALAPLQRFAEGVAEKAMPGVKPVGEMSENERLALYRRQVEAAWADGAISGDERRLLDAARQALGIDAETAFTIEREAAP